MGHLGTWRRVPGPRFDLWVLLGMHATGCVVSYTYSSEVFFRYFSPRFDAPYTLLLSLFSPTTPWELLWLYGMLFSTGPAMQRALGRLGFLVLYVLGAASTTLLSAWQRHSATGKGGPLAIVTYHALLAPNARHSIFGVEMGAKAALAVQIGVCTWPAFTGDAPKPWLLIALNALPAMLGAVMFVAGE